MGHAVSAENLGVVCTIEIGEDDSLKLYATRSNLVALVGPELFISQPNAPDCIEGWILTTNGQALSANDPLISPTSWASQEGRAQFEGLITSTTFGGGTDELFFLGCENPSSDDEAALFPETTYFYCGSVVYAFRRISTERTYACARFYRLDSSELYWGCFEVVPPGNSGAVSNPTPPPQPPQQSVLGDLVLSPKCVGPGESLTIVGESLRNRQLAPDAVKINGITTEIQAFRDAGLVVRVPSYGEGSSTVSIDGLNGVAHFQASTFCGMRALTEEDVAAGFMLNELILFLKPGLSEQEIEKFKIEYGFLSLKEYPTLGFYRGVVQSLTEMESILSHFNSSSGIKVAEVAGQIRCLIIEVFNNGVSATAVTFTTACLDADDDLVDVGLLTDWEWDFGDGNVSDLPPPLTHDFGEEGEYVIDVKVAFKEEILNTQSAVEIERPRVDCEINVRDSVAEQDILLLLDVSGTMDRPRLEQVVKSMLDQMYCFVNRNSQVALMSYSGEAFLDKLVAPWEIQHENILAWLERSFIPAGESNLEAGLRSAMAYLELFADSGNSKNILVVTRGSENPVMSDPQIIIDRALEQGIAIQGLGLINEHYHPRMYNNLRQIARATGRSLIEIDERRIWELEELTKKMVLEGIYGLRSISESTTDLEIEAQIPPFLEDPEDLIQFSISIDQDPRVERAFLNELIDVVQVDPMINDEDWLLALGLPQGWDTFFPRRGSGTSIAIIDTGADLRLSNNPAVEELLLNAKTPEGLNFAPVPPEERDPLGQDDIGHGTVVSTIAAALGNNGRNGSGVAPNASVIPMKIFAKVGRAVKGSNEGVAQAMMNAFSLGVDVVNMSLGCRGCDARKEAALKEYFGKILDNLIAKQIATNRTLPIIVAATGNDGEALIDSPASHPFVIAVGSIGADLESRSSFSNYGPLIDFVALGEETQTTKRGGTFESAGSGTSFAAPQVAGLVALILAETPGLTPEEIRSRIVHCYVKDIGPLGYDEETGYGRIHIPSPTEAPPNC